MIIRARCVATMAGAPVENGAVAIAGNRIEDVGAWAEVRSRNSGDVLDLDEHVLLPGLINAHCHLDYTMLRGTIPTQSSFTDWIRAINARKAALTDDDYVAAIDAGAAEALRFGTTAMVNYEAFPQLLPRISRPPLRVWWLTEMINLRANTSARSVYEQMRSAFDAKRDWLGGVGLAPHAPYTASPRLYADTSALAAEREVLVSTHLAESREEMAMFQDGAGALFDFVCGIGRVRGDCGDTTPLAWLRENVADHQEWVIAHLNELTDADLSSLRASHQFHIVHCPRSHAYFGHSAFRLDELRAAGVNVCVGTDSLASNDDLSLLAELRQMSKNYPHLSPCDLLEMVTTNAAGAVQQRGTLGQVTVGALADLIAIPITGGDIFEQVIAFEGPVPWVMVDGREVGLA